MNRKLIVVSNRLPYYQDRNQQWVRASGGLINAVEPIVINTGGTWIGWSGGTSLDFNQYQVNTLSPQTKHLPDAYQISCVPLSEKEISGYYDHFSNETLWALFHYFFEKCAISDASWKTYKEINQRFAHYIHQVADPESIVWIQDYHLMLAPYYLKQLRPELNIHFFLHIPFPHVDIYSILPWGKEILESLTQCASIGFHHKQYLTNFEGAVSQTLSKKNQSQCFVNPISIDFELFNSTSKKESVLQKREAFKQSIGSLQTLIGIDRIDYSKGIPERLLAVEQLLQEHPELKEQFVYYQLTVPSRENVVSYQDLKKEVDELVGRINGTFSTDKWAPVHYHYGSEPFEELVAHYLAADIALVTPLRDGMNLVCKEFIASHSDGKGILILSKFAGAISEIDDCLPINPYSIENIKNAILKALNMPEEERIERMKKMRKAIKSYDIHTWWQKCQQYF